MKHSRLHFASTAESKCSPLILNPQHCDARLLDDISTEYALRNGIVPLGRKGSITLVGAESFENFQQAHPKLEATFGSVAFVEMNREQVRSLIEDPRSMSMAHRATLRTSARESCRSLNSISLASWGALVITVLALIVLADPGLALLVVVFWATITLTAVTALRTLGAIVQLRTARRLGLTWFSRRNFGPGSVRLPTISLLVPLYEEQNIAAHLVERLCKLDYPKAKVDCLLILEQSDSVTERALAAIILPNWISIIRVPTGTLKTKPRAMNYALDYARGQIVGIFDAEDAPAPDQLRRVADAFERAPENVACLQGVLDFYNSRQSWLTRCFTIDYASWFRLVLPGLVRLGFSIPLGGTTVFFRRDILERIGRWDAHNVTEDADLGIRLARRGYRTEFIPSVTLEEATATVPTWVRQRSRWIKGYAITWAVHMRQPVRLWRELGPWRFFGFHALFLGTLSQFVLAPVLWSFWLIPLGLPHPITDVAPWGIIVTLAILFFISEVATLLVAALAVSTPKHRGLIWWVPLMHLYFPLSAIACWKGLAELIFKPFYWDKTTHGLTANQPILHQRPA
ncbi:MAG: glycosyltransferase [Boseongicola sp.]|nr:MAG: glycosyltransferase [Boseongicola sp.]